MMDAYPLTLIHITNIGRVICMVRVSMDHGGSQLTVNVKASHHPPSSDVLRHRRDDRKRVCGSTDQ